MSDTSSQLPADIRESAERLAELVKANGEHLRAIRKADTADAAYEALSDGLLNQMAITSEVQKLLCWIRVGQMPQIAVVGTRIAPAQGLSPRELRSLHIANDHTVDPELEEYLTLEGAR